MKNTINCKGKLIDFNQALVMGILNITPDSFYDGGKYVSIDSVKTRIDKMLTEGVSIIDIGAASSRPGATEISFDEEKKRLLPVLEVLKKEYPNVITSVDTYRSEIAKIAIEDYGVAIINDIFAGTKDAKMFETVAELNVPYIMMHIKGTPITMQQNPTYNDLFQEIFDFFSEKINKLKLLGVNDIIIDPGFGFGKTLEDNFEILNHLDRFKIFDLPILVGLSRKSMIYKALNSSPENSLNGTSVLNTIALERGANILRVHDIKEATEVVDLFSKLHS